LNNPTESMFDKPRTFWSTPRSSLNWLALGLLLAAWNAADHDDSKSDRRRRKFARLYLCVRASSAAFANNAALIPRAYFVDTGAFERGHRNSLQESQKRKGNVKLHTSNGGAFMLATETNKQILIVDRDVAAVEPLRQRLSDAGFNVRAITDGAAAAMAVAERPPHLVIIDWNMPGFTALDLIQGSGRTFHPSRPADHFVGARRRAGCRGGLNFGADDYIAKPFSLREVVARVSAVLRSRSLGAQPSTLSCDSLVLDSATNRVTAHGRLINLRGIEYRLLEFLMSNLGRTFNRTQLLDPGLGRRHRCRRAHRRRQCAAAAQDPERIGLRILYPDRARLRLSVRAAGGPGGRPRRGAFLSGKSDIRHILRFHAMFHA
jgi:two-component system phosphate regulon response regulator PhoB